MPQILLKKKISERSKTHWKQSCVMVHTVGLVLRQDRQSPRRLSEARHLAFPTGPPPASSLQPSAPGQGDGAVRCPAGAWSGGLCRDQSTQLPTSLTPCTSDRGLKTGGVCLILGLGCIWQRTEVVTRDGYRPPALSSNQWGVSAPPRLKIVTRTTSNCRQSFPCWIRHWHLNNKLEEIFNILFISDFSKEKALRILVLTWSLLKPPY